MFEITEFQIARFNCSSMTKKKYYRDPWIGIAELLGVSTGQANKMTQSRNEFSKLVQIHLKFHDGISIVGRNYRRTQPTKLTGSDASVKNSFPLRPADVSRNIPGLARFGHSLTTPSGDTLMTEADELFED